MKIMFVDVNTNDVVLSKNNPCHILIKPKAKRVKVIEDENITEFNFKKYDETNHVDVELDLLEKVMTIFVYAETRQEYKAGDH